MVEKAEAPDLITYEGELVAALLDLDATELGVVRSAAEDTPKRRAEAALHDRDFLRAADHLAELGFVSDEMYLRLEAGQRLLAEGRAEEGRAQIERALEFYRGVRATRFVAEAEALLAGAERASA
jgi:hypothetical protein